MLKSFMNSASLLSLATFAKDSEGSEPEFKNDVTEIREAFEGEDGKGRSLNLSDETLDMVVTNAGDKWDELDFKGKIALLEKAEKEAAKVGIANPQITALVKKFDEDDAAQEELIECIEAVIKNKTTAVDMYAVFHRIYTREELDSMPRAGWEEKDCEGTNFKPDIVRTKSANGTPITTVWTNDFVSASRRGKAYETVIDETSKEIKSSGSVPKYKNFSKKALEDTKAVATQARNAMRSMVKRALDLHHAFEAISGMEQVEIEWVTVPADAKEKHILIPKRYGTGKLGEDALHVTRGPKPFWMYPKGKASDGKLFSVTQITNMDVYAAVAAGGTMADLVATISRGADDGAEGDGDGADWGEEEAMEGTSKLANFFHKRDNVAMISKILADKKHPERADWLENISTLYFAIKPLYLKNQSAIEEVTGAKEEKVA